MTEEQDLRDLLTEIKENQEEILYKISDIQKREAENSKDLSKIVSNSAGGKLKLKNGAGEPTEEAFEVLTWITKQGKSGVKASELGKKYRYESRSGYKRAKDKLDALFPKLIKIHDSTYEKGHRILNPIIKEKSPQVALLMVKAKFVGKVSCPGCHLKHTATKVVEENRDECPSCGENPLEKLERKEVSIDV